MSKISFSFGKGLVLVLAGLIAGYKSIGQDGVLGKVNIASPNAAALGKYVDIPVSNHTGIPQTNIPLYTLQEGPLSLPISLSYHAGGIKLNEMAGWVGLGWSLNAGGVITRTVRGTPDECGVAEFMKNDKGHLGHNGYNNYAFERDRGGNNDCQSPLPTEDVFKINGFTDGIKDGEPDLFFFNFGGHSGKFYLNDDGQPVLIPQADYKIEYVYNHGAALIEGITKFIITTSDGTKYVFGKTDALGDTDPVEITHNYYETQPYLYCNEYGECHTIPGGYPVNGANLTINSWYLNKIISADNLFSISLTYSPEEFSYRSVSGNSKNSGDYLPNSPSNWQYFDHLVKGIRLTGITSSAINIVFEPGTARQDLSEWTVAGNFDQDVATTKAKTLAAVKITNNTGFCKNYRFTYSYFNSDIEGLPEGTYSVTDLKRLKLDELKEESCDGSATVPPYQFEYFAEQMPRRLSFAMDHWGFINGKTDNKDLIPTFVEKGSDGLLTEFSGADRDSYWPAMRAGSLKKITYPTGGFTDFEFEPNTTFLSYNKYNKEFRFQMSMGYDGNPYTVTQNQVFTANPYTIKLRNTNSGGSASLSISGSSYVTADPGQTVLKNVILTPGTNPVSLYKINPSTGNGVEAFFYEWVPTPVTENRIVGGLRIKRISFNTGTGANTLITDYSYDEANGQSSGHLYSKPTYVQFVRNNFLRDAGRYPRAQTSPCSTNAVPYDSPEGFEYPTTGPYATWGFPYLISSVGIRPMETTQGNHIGYNEVKVSSPDNGYSVYRYYGSNIWDANRNDVAIRFIARPKNSFEADLVPNFPETPQPTDYKRGDLKYAGVFNQTNQLIKENFYYYEYTENILKTPAFKVATGTSFRGLPSWYDVSTAKLTKSTIQERVFQPVGGYLETLNDNFYSSSYHNQLTKSTATTSKGELIETNYKYSIDFKPANCAAIDDGVATYNTNCATCQTQYYQARAALNHNNAYWKYWDYQALLKCNSLARTQLFTARKNYFNPSVAGSYANCIANAKAVANSDLKPILELQDKFMVTPIEITSFKNSKLTTAVFNKFDYTPNLSNVVYPVKTQQINLTAPSASFTPVVINGTGLTKDSRYEDEVSVKIENGNISEVIGKDGVPTSYIWGHSNTLPIVKAVGVNAATLLAAYTAIGVGADISLLRSHPSLNGAFISTYVYAPGIGIKRETDPRGRTIYYYYDKLNRLIVIKDHDNKVIKKICYNYAGQPENCNTPCLNTTPDWQNTTTPHRCQQDAWGNNTGYVEQEQKDMNACSPTYNITQWNVSSEQNHDICPPAQIIKCTNKTGLRDYQAVYKNINTGQTFRFNISDAAGAQVIGSLPWDTYSLQILPPAGSSATLKLGSGCAGMPIITGVSASFANVIVSPSDCNTIIMEY